MPAFFCLYLWGVRWLVGQFLALFYLCSLFHVNKLHSLEGRGGGTAYFLFLHWKNHSQKGKQGINIVIYHICRPNFIGRLNREKLNSRLHSSFTDWRENHAWPKRVEENRNHSNMTVYFWRLNQLRNTHLPMTLNFPQVGRWKRQLVLLGKWSGEIKTRWFYEDLVGAKQLCLFQRVWKTFHVKSFFLNLPSLEFSLGGVQTVIARWFYFNGASRPWHRAIWRTEKQNLFSSPQCALGPRGVTAEW